MHTREKWEECFPKCVLQFGKWFSQYPKWAVHHTWSMSLLHTENISSQASVAPLWVVLSVYVMNQLKRRWPGMNLDLSFCWEAAEADDGRQQLMTHLLRFSELWHWWSNGTWVKAQSWNPKSVPVYCFVIFCLHLVQVRAEMHRTVKLTLCLVLLIAVLITAFLKKCWSWSLTTGMHPEYVCRATSVPSLTLVRN